jgi:hypothetical protein
LSFNKIMTPSFTNSGQVGQQIQTLLNTAGTADPAYADKINTAIAQKVQGLQPQYNELGNLEAQTYAMPVTGMADYEKKFGPSYKVGQGVSPLQYLSGLTSNFQSNLGRANALRNTIGTVGGSLKDIAGSVADSYKTGLSNIYQQIGALQPVFSTLSATEQAQKAQDKR